MRLKTLLVSLYLAVVATHANAENIGQALGSQSTPKGYFQVGVAGGWYDSPMEGEIDQFGSVVFEGRYQWRGLFVEATTDSIGVPGLAVGYELWQNRFWALDIAIVPSIMGFDPKDFERLKNSELVSRTDESSVIGGIRATRFFDNFLLQAHLLPIGRGVVLALAAGRYWQVKNWTLTALAAARYDSKEINRIWSVNADEASALFPAYQAEDGVSFSAALRAEYPVTEHWVVQSSVFFNQLSSAVADSPITAQDYGAGVALEISYVF